MDRKILIATICILLLLTMGGLLALLKVGNIKLGYKTETISPNVLYLTEPVHSFSGTVEKVSGGSFVVTRTFVSEETMPAPPLDPSSTEAPVPTPQSKKLTYTVIITDKTAIGRSPFSIPFLFVTPTPPTEQKLTIKDIKVGEKVTIQTDKDLRTLRQNQFEATSITLPDITNTFQGRITNVGTDRITLKSMMPEPETDEKEYTVMLNADTEISYLSQPDKDQNQKPVKLAISDLKKDMQVTVYTNIDVTKQQTFTALRIEPVLPSPPTEPPPLPEPEQLVANPSTATPSSLSQSPTPIPTISAAEPTVKP